MTDTTIPDLIANLRRLRAAGTQGEWVDVTITTVETHSGIFYPGNIQEDDLACAAVNAAIPLCDEVERLTAEVADSHRAHEETLGSCRREYERGLQRCTLLTEQSLRLTKERDRYREAIVKIREHMGGEDCAGWESPEDVWGIANTALTGEK